MGLAWLGKEGVSPEKKQAAVFSGSDGRDGAQV